VSLADRFERRLEGLVGGAFARVFKGQVEPVEIGSALQREAADKKSIVGSGQIMCPNRYRITLALSDYERLTPWDVQLTTSLAELVQEYLDENRWSTIGDIEVYLALDEQLHTGIFGVASRMDSSAPPRRRPHDSLSIPAVRDGFDPAAPLAAPVAAAVVAPGAVGLDTPPPATRPAAPPAPPVAAPRPTSTPVLLVDQTDEQLQLHLGSNVVGRGSESDLQLLDQGVSRRHLDVQYDGHRATAYDLGSTNGTTVNGHQVGSAVLQHGDVIRIGHTRLVYQQGTG
jgi:hypothetical protein